jgi:hypothetical protein
MTRNEKSYRTLGLKPESSLEEIGRAYERMKLAWDPDKFVGNAPLEKRAAEKLKEIERAYTNLLEAHGIDVSEGPPPSLFDDALADRLAKPQKRLSKQKIGALVAVAIAIVLVVFLAIGDESGSGEDATATDPAGIEGSDPAANETTPDQEQPAFEIQLPAGQQSAPASSSGQPAPTTPARVTPIKVAFELLQEKSPTVRKLVSDGFPELRYRGWKAVKADPPEVTIALLAEKPGDSEATTYLWSVNMETERAKALNKQAVELDTPRPPSARPKLVREE